MVRTYSRHHDCSVFALELFAEVVSQRISITAFATLVACVFVCICVYVCLCARSFYFPVDRDQVDLKALEATMSCNRPR